MRILFLIIIFPVIASAQIKINSGGRTIGVNKPGYTSSIKITGDSGTPTPPSEEYLKDFQEIANPGDYEAFGHLQRIHADTVALFLRAGSDHLQGGKIYCRKLNLITNTWSSRQLVYEDPEGLDMRDVWGGIMDNGESVIFSSASGYFGEGFPLTSYAVILKGDPHTLGYSNESLFNFGVPQMQRGVSFGEMQKGNTPGTYYIAFWQFNIDDGTDDKPTFPLYRIDVLKTTDYWNTWSVLNVYEGTNQYSECALTVYPDDNDKMTMLVRRDPGGFPAVYESSNGGSSWTYRGISVQVGLNGTKSKSLFSHTNSNGLMDVFFGDRDDGWIKVSRNNNYADYFGGNTLNEEELYGWMRVGPITVGDNYKLGYPTVIELSEGNYLVVYFKQHAVDNARGYWTKHTITIDNGLPATPPELIANPSYIASTTALIYTKMDDQSGYTAEQLNNIRWFEVCLSTDNFSTFVNAKVVYNSGAASIEGEINNIRVATHQFNFYGLTSATTYQCRIRAVNNNGASEWATIEFTTD